MLDRRIDSIYLAFLALAAGIGYIASDAWNASEGSSDDVGNLADPSVFDAPQLVLEAPFEFPYSIPSFETRSTPVLHISDNLETVIVQVRSTLLASSTLVPARQTEGLAAVVE